MTKSAEKMKCIEILNPGSKGVLNVTERDIPKPKKGEVLIKVSAAGLNRPDLIQKLGKYDPPAGITDIPGLEISGVIVEFGEDGDIPPIKEFEIGENVCALVSGGGYAQYCVVPLPQCLPVPKGVSLVEAASLPETFFTVWKNVYEHGGLQPYETLLVHGGTSGIGVAAIQFAKSFGARVCTTVGSEDKRKFCELLGADIVVNYKEQDFVDVISKVTGGCGVNVVLDMIGGDYLLRNLEVLTTGGRHVSIAAMHGSRAEIDILTIMRKKLIMTGSTLRSQSIEEKTRIARLLYEEVWPKIERKKIRPIVDSIFLLEEADKAQKLMEDGTHKGKIVLNI